MADLSDTAKYTCVAINIAGKTTREFNLSVNGTDKKFICKCLCTNSRLQLCVNLSTVPLVAPTIKDGPQTVSVHVNKPAVLECLVSGVPPPRVTWRKHGAVLTGNNPR